MPIFLKKQVNSKSEKIRVHQRHPSNPRCHYSARGKIRVNPCPITLSFQNLHIETQRPEFFLT